jgi:hypothetical protein
MNRWHEPALQDASLEDRIAGRFEAITGVNAGCGGRALAVAALLIGDCACGRVWRHAGGQAFGAPAAGRGTADLW